MQKPRAVGLLPVCLTVKPVGEPDAGNRHVRFDERGWETERCRMAQATAPILDLRTEAAHLGCPLRSVTEGKQTFRGHAEIDANEPKTDVADGAGTPSWSPSPQLGDRAWWQ